MSHNLIWALIIVTNSANVSLSTGYNTKELCENAISVAKTGKTIEENKALAEEKKIKEKEFIDSHPDRIATKEDEKKCQYTDEHHHSIDSLHDPYCIVNGDTKMVHFTYYPLISVIEMQPYDKNEIKFAKCVKVEKFK